MHKEYINFLTYNILNFHFNALKLLCDWGDEMDKQEQEIKSVDVDLLDEYCSRLADEKICITDDYEICENDWFCHRRWRVFKQSSNWKKVSLNREYKNIFVTTR